MDEQVKYHKDMECIHCRKFYTCKGKIKKGVPCMNIKEVQDGNYEPPGKGNDDGEQGQVDKVGY